MQVTREDIAAISRLVYRLCGLILDETKGYLIDSRLARIATTASCSTFRELADKASLPSQRTLQTEIIDAITTQETLFFRDGSPFEVLQHKVLPDLIDGKAATAIPRRLRLWSAACSTGQEPYSLAMALCETIPGISSWNVNVLATDISNAAIKQASMGRYAKHEIQRGMKPGLLTRYFIEEPGSWKVKDELRALVSFSRRNLLESLNDLGPFNVIFCRNVAIYFDPKTRHSLFHRLADRLTPDGAVVRRRFGIADRSRPPVHSATLLPSNVLPTEQAIGGRAGATFRNSATAPMSCANALPT